MMTGSGHLLAWKWQGFFVSTGSVRNGSGLSVVLEWQGFLGSTGLVMAGSGHSVALECCYGPNAVVHMISG